MIKPLKTCGCEDSDGVKCKKKMTPLERKQDGMCQNCADQVWNEITSKDTYHWTHPKKECET